eukprot:CAMPEP_0170135956 /NCGR_PEP_ID=MMETSP0033_2-20121228/2863_1 /TAXON_ID=195969 /ORGANISM="Dolichomastix tenuilepis, Strain CCMP3274" /LENGTH=36 /DNA_ID= /DNA_START= /DNA_END= /DNA_ORIENTATION=
MEGHLESARSYCAAGEFQKAISALSTALARGGGGAS